MREISVNTDGSEKLKEALIKTTCAVGEQILCPPRRKSRRNTLCISRFLQRRRVQNLPPNVRGDLFSVSLIITSLCKILLLLPPSAGVGAVLFFEIK